MEFARSNLQRLRHWPGQDLRVSVRASTDRPHSAEAFRIPLGSCRFCGCKSFCSDPHLRYPMSTAERHVESQSQRDVSLGAPCLHSWVYKLW